MNADETTLIIVTELFDDEEKPREVLACKKCGQAYKTRHDVINFCSNCGRKIIGEKPFMDEKSRAFIFGERFKDTPEIPQMTKEQMEECINETEKYIPKTVKE